MRISVAAALPRTLVAIGLAVALGAAAGCTSPHRSLTLVPTLAPCPGAATVNTVRVTAQGDFPPEATLTAAASPTAMAELALPRATRVVAVEGFGPTGLAAFGRTAPLSLDGAGARLGVAYGPPDGLCATANMNQPRGGHRATRLASGAVLVTGGFDGALGVSLRELYLPSGDAASPAASFRALPDPLPLQAVLLHAVAPLGDGGALVCGGVSAASDGAPSGIAYAGATRYGADGRQVGQPRLLVGGPRAGHSATALSDGRVLIAGGCADFDGGSCRAGATLASTEIYDPKSDTFAGGPPLLRPRWDHDAIVRGDGTVLLVGGRSEGGAALPAEVVDPDELRSFDAGLVNGRAAPLATGGVLVAGGVVAPDSGAALWLSPSEAPLPLPPLGDPRRAPTLTPLDDGGVLIAGGGDGALFVYDGRGGVSALAARFSRRAHAAAALADGTVLLAGGVDGAGATTAAAALYFRSPLSAWASLPPLTLDGPADPYLPRRPDRAVASAGRLLVGAPAATSDGRPAELALVAGMQVADFSFDLLAGRRGSAAGALVVGWQSEAAYDFVVVEPGRAVELWSVSSPRVGQSVSAPVAGCRGATLADGALPDDDHAPVHLDWRGGTLTLLAAGQPLLRCRPSPPLARGRVGVAALRGTVAFDNLALTR